ncbi:MAG: hypothetical protein AB1486_31570 [Planctomycetota bacterium]
MAPPASEATRAVTKPWTLRLSLLMGGLVLALPVRQEANDPPPPEESKQPTAGAGDGCSVASEAVRSSVLATFGRLPLAFVENRGQLDEHVSFAVRAGGLQAFFTEAAIVLQLVSRAPSPRLSPDPMPTREGDEKITAASVLLVFEGALPEVTIEG